MVITLGTVITVFVAWFLVTSIIVVKLVREDDLPAGLIPHIYMISAFACVVIWLIDRNWDRVLFKI